MKTLAILGAGGHAKVVADAAICAGWSEIVFFDDSYPMPSSIGPWEIIGDGHAFLRRAGEFSGFTVAIGDNRTRLNRANQLIRLELNPLTPVTIAHPSSVISKYASIGQGSVLMAGAVVNAFARLGALSIINSGATIDHDCELADGVHISPGAHLAGGVRVGRCAWIGIGAVVRQGIVIGKDVTVGAGAAVIEDIPDGLTVIGVPAKSRRRDSLMGSD